jgi:hypothetical protein
MTQTRPTLIFAAALLLAGLAFAGDAAAAPAAAAQAAPVPVLRGSTVIKDVAAPNADDLAKGDPAGDKTGTVSDVAVADSKTGLTLADLANQAGQNKVAINFTWTLIAGFLVMFMQAGFALVETGLCRAKNANHTMMMNFMVYGVAAHARVRHQSFRKKLGTVRNQRVLPERRDVRRGRDGAVPVPDGVHGYGADHRHRLGSRALEICRVRDLLGADGRHHLSSVRELGMGRRLALDFGHELRTGTRLC